MISQFKKRRGKCASFFCLDSSAEIYSFSKLEIFAERDFGIFGFSKLGIFAIVSFWLIVFENTLFLRTFRNSKKSRFLKTKKNISDPNAENVNYKKLKLFRYIY